MSFGWRDLPEPARGRIEQLLTPRELDAWKLSMDGAGYRTIAHALGLHESTARDRLRSARRKLADDPDLEAIVRA